MFTVTATMAAAAAAAVVEVTMLWVDCWRGRGIFLEAMEEPNEAKTLLKAVMNFMMGPH